MGGSLAPRLRGLGVIVLIARFDYTFHVRTFNKRQHCPFSDYVWMCVSPQDNLDFKIPLKVSGHSGKAVHGMKSNSRSSGFPAAMAAALNASRPPVRMTTVWPLGRAK